MAGIGPPPKPAHLRQRTNKKAGSGTLEAPTMVRPREISNPDGRVWHSLTVAAWDRAWASPMASRWLETDADALGRLALLWDEFYNKPAGHIMAEIRLQEQRFGLSPLDRSRLQWEILRTDEAERKKPQAPEVKRTGTRDPRSFLTAIK